MGVLKALVVLALVAAVVVAVEVESDADRPRRRQRRERKLVQPTIIASKHLMPKSRVVIVPKGDVRARAPQEQVQQAPFSPVLKATSASCAAANGQCIPKASCAAPNFIKTGLCPGSDYCCVRGTPPAPLTGVAAVANFADQYSACSKRSWRDRGTAPISYVRGLAVSYAKAVCNPTRSDVVFVGNAQTGSNDALSWYGSILRSKLGATSSGLTTVRQLYTLLLGLGMRESSGQWCVGRDMSASFSSSTTAEAGLFQTSWGANTRSSLMRGLFNQYKASKGGCAFDIYSKGVSCSASNLKNWGAASEEGYQWQALTKSCPSFATEYAAVLLRLNGGSKGEWGPLRNQVAEVVKDCYDMFGAVETYVRANPSVCPLLAAQP